MKTSDNDASKLLIVGSVCLLLGFLLGILLLTKTTFLAGVFNYPNQSTSYKESPAPSDSSSKIISQEPVINSLLDKTISLNINVTGEFTKVDENNSVVTIKVDNLEFEIPVIPSVKIDSDTKSASPSGNLETLALNKPVVASLSKQDGSFKIKSIFYPR